MNSTKNQLLGYCGLYCGNCLYYQNTVNGSGTPKKDGSIVFCEGCDSNINTPHCASCAIKDCNRNKDIRYCLKCSEFPCEIITAFIENPDFAYHKKVPDMMKRLEEIGFEAWELEMEQNYTCKSCGNHFTYFDSDCPKCPK